MSTLADGIKILSDNGLSAPAWGFFGILVTGVVAILTEQIRSRRKTEEVKSEVVELKTLAEKIDGITERLDDHIRWHLNRSAPQFIPLQRRKE